MPDEAVRWRQVTLAGNVTGNLAAGWVHADVADFLNQTVQIGGDLYTVVQLAPSMPEPTNHLPRWPDATRVGR
jgi:hypothetical protein